MRNIWKKEKEKERKTAGVLQTRVPGAVYPYWSHRNNADERILGHARAQGQGSPLCLEDPGSQSNTEDLLTVATSREPRTE